MAMSSHSRLSRRLQFQRLEPQWVMNAGMPLDVPQAPPEIGAMRRHVDLAIISISRTCVEPAPIHSLNPHRRDFEMKRRMMVVTAGVALLSVSLGGKLAAEEYLSDIQWAKPKVVDPGPPGGPPADAIVLFDGKDMSKWNGADKWTVKDGIIVAGPGQITSKEQFGDCQVHIEWTSDETAEGSGQGRSNSGVFLMGKYEVQVLDSYENETYYDGQCGAIYKQSPPLANVCRKPGQWQTYDIIWAAPRFKDGKLVSPAYVTVLQNGVLIQNHFALEGDTPFHRPPAYHPHGEKGPIALQYHGNPVRFRNIWVREIKPLKKKRVHEPKIVKH